MKRLVIPDGECHVRAKIAEITHLLYHTACSVAKWAPEAAEGHKPSFDGTNCVTTLNPTVGVRQRLVMFRIQDTRMTLTCTMTVSKIGI